MVLENNLDLLDKEKAILISEILGIKKGQAFKIVRPQKTSERRLKLVNDSSIKPFMMEGSGQELMMDLLKDQNKKREQSLGVFKGNKRRRKIR